MPADDVDFDKRFGYRTRWLNADFSGEDYDYPAARYLNFPMVGTGEGKVAGLRNESNRFFEHLADDIEVVASTELWQMLQYEASIYTDPSASSEPMGVLVKCSIVKGIWMGDGWVQLKQGEGGYAPAVAQGVPVLARLKFERRRQKGGYCEDVGLYTIESQELCAAAGAATGLGDWYVYQAEGCFAVNMWRPEALEPLCSSLRPCYTTTLTSTTHATFTLTTATTRAPTTITSVSDVTATPTGTSTTSLTGGLSTTATTTPRHFDHPSLFCFEVFIYDSYETRLVIDQMNRKASIFLCDEHMLISEGSNELAADDGRAEVTTGIGSLTCEKGGWGSWVNAPVFRKAWLAVISDGRYDFHDWVVKVDADCVFRPSHLKAHLMKFHGKDRITQKVFFKNFMDGYPVVGAIEITSSVAVPDLGGEVCAGMVTDAAEDDWFVKCLQRTGAQMEDDDSLLQHEDQPSGNLCADRWWVAMHPFKDLNRYRWCDMRLQD